MHLGSVLAGVIGKQPDLAVALVLGRIASGQAVGPPLDDGLGRLAVACAPEGDVAVLENIADPWADLDLHLEGQPFVGDVAKAVAVRCEVAGAALRVKAERCRAPVFQLEVVGTVVLLEGIVRPVRARAGAGVVHLREAALVGVLHHRFERRAGRVQLSGLVSGADDDLLPAPAPGEDRVDELGTETLAPLDVELLVAVELHRQVVREVREKRARTVGR